MSEVIAALPFRVIDTDGEEYYVSVVGEARADGRWEAWLEFVPDDEFDPLLTLTETTQTRRADVVRWADNLSETYVQEAFKRAVSVSAEVPPRMVARRTVADAAAEAAAGAVRGEIPDPFDLYVSGQSAMRARLSVLPRATLLYIITTFGLNPAGKSLSWLSDHQLVTFIITAVEVQTASGTRAT